MLHLWIASADIPDLHSTEVGRKQVGTYCYMPENHQHTIKRQGATTVVREFEIPYHAKLTQKRYNVLVVRYFNTISDDYTTYSLSYLRRALLGRRMLLEAPAGGATAAAPEGVALASPSALTPISSWWALVTL
jgi:hypothetical protein